MSKSGWEIDGNVSKNAIGKEKWSSPWEHVSHEAAASWEGLFRTHGKPLPPRMPGLPWDELEKHPQSPYSRGYCQGTLPLGCFLGSQKIRWLIETVDEGGQSRAESEASPHLGTLFQLRQSESSLFWFPKEHVIIDCFLFLNNFVYLFVFGCPGSSLLCQLFSSCREPGYSLVVVHELLIAVAFLVFGA